jgi:hypothetical protein
MFQLKYNKIKLFSRKDLFDILVKLLIHDNQLSEHYYSIGNLNILSKYGLQNPILLLIHYIH